VARGDEDEFALFDSLAKGAGTVRITAMELRDLEAGQRPGFASMRFEVELRIPTPKNGSSHSGSRPKTPRR